MSKCNYMNRPGLSMAAREMGCPLDHCANNHHVIDLREDGSCSECESGGFCGMCGERHDGLSYDEHARFTHERDECSFDDSDFEYDVQQDDVCDAERNPSP